MFPPLQDFLDHGTALYGLSSWREWLDFHRHAGYVLLIDTAQETPSHPSALRRYGLVALAFLHIAVDRGLHGTFGVFFARLLPHRLSVSWGVVSIGGRILFGYLADVMNR